MMKKRKLGFGQYSATEEFRAIKNHSCVCFLDDMGLVAVTGPADDKDSQEYAELFAVAPELLDAMKENQAVLKYIYSDIQSLPVRDDLLATVATKIQENRALIKKVNNHEQ